MTAEKQLTFNHNKLKGRIVEKYGSITKFANEKGLSRQVVSSKVTGARNFTRDEIVYYSEWLDIEPAEIGTYFFTLEV